MRLGDHFDIAEPQAESRDIDRFFEWNPEIPVENHQLEFQRDAYSPVLNQDADTPFFFIAMDQNPFFVGRILNGVVDQVQQSVAVV